MNFKNNFYPPTNIDDFALLKMEACTVKNGLRLKNIGPTLLKKDDMKQC